MLAAALPLALGLALPAHADTPAALDALEATSPHPLQVHTRGGHPHMITGFRAGPWTGTPEAVAHSFVGAWPDLLSIPAGHTLEVESVVPGHLGSRVRLRQAVGGVPVWGGLAVVGVDRDGAVDLLRADLVDVGSLDLVPSIDAARAVSSVRATLGAVHTGEPELILLPLMGLAWQVLAWGDVGTLVHVDAHTGEVLRADPVVHHAQGYAYPGPVPEGEAPVDLARLVEGEGLVGDRTSVVSQVWVGSNAREISNAVADEDGNFWYPPDGGSYVDGFAEVNTYYAIETMRDWYEDAMGYSHAPPVHAVVNWQSDQGSDFYNAYATIGDGSTQLRFGQGGEHDYAYPPAIVGHELTHGVLFEVLPWEVLGFYFDLHGTTWVHGSMHEGISDYFPASVLDEKLLGQWDDGEYMRNLGRDLSCPRDLDAEVHADGLVLVSALWAVRDEVGPEVADDLVWAAVSAYMPADGYDAIATMMVAEAEELVVEGRLTADQATAVSDILTERGIFDCGRRVHLGEGGYTVSSMIGAEGTGIDCEVLQNEEIYTTMDLQLGIRVPEEVEGLLSLTINLEPREGWSHDPISRSELGYSVVVSDEDLVRWSQDEYLGFPCTHGPRNGVVEVHDSPTSIVLTPEDGITHEPGTTWTIAVYGLNCVDVEYRISATWNREVPEVPDDTDGDDESPSGCGCASPSPATGWLVIPALLLGLCRRRTPQA